MTHPRHHETQVPIEGKLVDTNEGDNIIVLELTPDDCLLGDFLGICAARSER
jgi:hypothetical protein